QGRRARRRPLRPRRRALCGRRRRLAVPAGDGAAHPRSAAAAARALARPRSPAHRRGGGGNRAGLAALPARRSVVRRGVIDAHAHLDALEDPEAAIRRAAEAGVTRILTVGTTIEGGRVALDLAGRHEGVFAILGIHPHEADAEGDRIDELAELLADPLAVAVGETGLDFYRDRAPRDRQRTVLDAELALAAELGKPVVIHSRA